MRTKPLVSVIIVNWNGQPYLAKCLTSLKAVTYSPLEIILVDNGSVDKSIFFIKKNYPQVKIIANKTNLGFCIANNIGFKQAAGKYILFLNNDTVVTKNFLSPLVEEMEIKPACGVIQPKLIIEKSQKLQSGGSFLTATGFLNHFGYGQNPKQAKYNKTSEIFSANGACMLVRREMVKKTGLFDEDFFAYFEESDFCWRVWLAGYKVIYYPKSVIYHRLGGTSKKLNPVFIEFHSFKNRINSLIKNPENINLIKILPLHICVSILIMVFYVLSLRFSNALAIIKAIIWNILKFNKTWNKRKKVQTEIRKVTDKKIQQFIFKPFSLPYLAKFSAAYLKRR